MVGGGGGLAKTNLPPFSASCADGTTGFETDVGVELTRPAVEVEAAPKTNLSNEVAVVVTDPLKVNPELLLLAGGVDIPGVLLLKVP